MIVATAINKFDATEFETQLWLCLLVAWLDNNNAAQKKLRGAFPPLEQLLSFGPFSTKIHWVSSKVLIDIANNNF